MEEKDKPLSADLIKAVQELHKKNPNVSAVTIGRQLGLTLDPKTLVLIIEGSFNYLVNK